jgi:hypothetical protein
MGEFFKGWRRKIGIVTLLMALVGMAGWVRGGLSVDFVWYPTAKFGYSIESLHGLVRLTRGTPVASGMPVQFGSESLSLSPHLKFDDYGKPLPFDPREKLDIEWQSNWFAFSFGTAKIKGSIAKIEMFLIPYWSIVIPMTVLSAYLLLTKSRKATPNKIPESLQNDGGAKS